MRMCIRCWSDLRVDCVPSYKEDGFAVRRTGKQINVFPREGKQLNVFLNRDSVLHRWKRGSIVPAEIARTGALRLPNRKTKLHS
jgi:hypothetical protein